MVRKEESGDRQGEWGTREGLRVAVRATTANLVVVVERPRHLFRAASEGRVESGEGRETTRRTRVGEREGRGGNNVVVGRYE